MYLVISKRVTAVILSNFSRHYLRNRFTSDIGVLIYDMIYDIYLTAIGLTPGGNITRHIYDKQYTQYIDSTILEVRAVLRLCE